VIRIHNDAGYVVLPHTHREDENIIAVRVPCPRIGFSPVRVQGRYVRPGLPGQRSPRVAQFAKSASSCKFSRVIRFTRETIKNNMTLIKLHRLSLEARVHTQHRWCQSGLDLRRGAARLSWKGARIRTLGNVLPAYRDPARFETVQAQDCGLPSEALTNWRPFVAILARSISEYVV
jgi:hypothetical protein